MRHRRTGVPVPVAVPLPSVPTQAAKRRHEDTDDDDEDANRVVVLLNSLQKYRKDYFSNDQQRKARRFKTSAHYDFFTEFFADHKAVDPDVNIEVGSGPPNYNKSNKPILKQKFLYYFKIASMINRRLLNRRFQKCRAFLMTLIAPRTPRNYLTALAKPTKTTKIHYANNFMSHAGTAKPNERSFVRESCGYVELRRRTSKLLGSCS